MLDGLTDAGFITKAGNTFHTILIDSAFYSADCEWYELNIDVPLYGFQHFAFKNDVAQEPYLFYATEIEIKFIAGTKTVKVTPFDEPFSNLDNSDLSDFFNNSKTVKLKTVREKALKEKKEKK